MDALTNILQGLRMRTRVFSRAEMYSPFGVRSEQASTGIFHAVVQGRIYLRGDGDEQVHCLSRGDVALLPGGNGHTITDEPASASLSIGELAAASPSGRVDLLEIPGPGPRTSIVCGLFAFEHSSAHAIVPELPTVIVARSRDDGPARSLTSILEIIAEEVGAERQGAAVVLSSLAEVLMVRALRLHIESKGQGPGWLCALRDPQVARAISIIHAAPSQGLSAHELASRVGLSRSELFSRFSELVGEPPARYATRWRMHLATKALVNERASLSEVAERIGYASEAAFSKAFKKFTGEAPGTFRQRELQKSQA